MKQFILVLLLLVSINGFTQTYFTGVYGDDGSNLIVKYTHTESGEYLYGVGFEGTVIKYDLNGSFIYMKKIDPDYYFYDFVETNDKSLLVAGMLLVAGTKQSIVAKLSEQGYIQWVKLYETGERMMQQQIVKPVNGVDEFILASWYLVSGSNDDIALTKMDADGGIIWNYRYDYADDQNDGIVPDGEGGVYVVGQSAGGDGEGNIMQVDNNGDFVTSKSFASLPYAFHKVIKASDGSIYIAGDSFNEALDDSRNPILVKLDSDMGFEWMRELQTGSGLGSYPITGGADVAEDHDGNIYITSVIYHGGEYQQSITKFSATGNMLWNKTLGYTLNTEPHFLRISTYFNGSYDFINMANSRDDGISMFGLNDVQLLSIGPDGESCYMEDIDFTIAAPSLTGYDAEYSREDLTFSIDVLDYVADSGQWNQTTCDEFEGIDDDRIQNVNINVYPNPASDYLMIDLSNLAFIGNNLNIDLLNLNGQIVFTKTINATGNYILLNNINLPSGLYTMKLTTLEGIITAQVMIE